MDTLEQQSFDWLLEHLDYWCDHKLSDGGYELLRRILNHLAGVKE